MDEQRLYDSLFPYYAEVCTVTQLARRGERPGGWGGHATMFLGGVELVPGAGHPRLRLAAPGAAGVGVSVNRAFRNANWVAVAGREAFFDGWLVPEAMLDDRAYDDAVARAMGAGWLVGVELSDAGPRRGPGSSDELVVRSSIGTDFALTFARSVYGARLPLPRVAMSRLVAYLNVLNEVAERAGYHWNAYTNNCSHVLHNALAAAGVWDPKAIRPGGVLDVLRDVASVSRSIAFRRMSDLSFPANNFVRVYEAGNERSVDDPRHAYRDHDIARTLAEGWLSTGPGALVTRRAMHAAGRNRLFVPGRDPFLFSLPLLWDKHHIFARLTRRPPHVLTDLVANLENVRARLTSAAERARADDAAGEYDAFRARFVAWLEDRLRLIDDGLRRARTSV